MLDGAVCSSETVRPTHRLSSSYELLHKASEATTAQLAQALSLHTVL